MKTQFDIVTPFQGWPILYAAYDGGDPVWQVTYSYDPHFRPPEAMPFDAILPFVTGVAGALGGTENFVPVPGRPLTMGMLVRDPALYDSLRPTNIGGSARPNTPIKGRQYWEVLVVELPSKVPPEQWFQIAGVAPGVFTWQSTIFPIDSFVSPLQSLQLYWPPGLNTFLSPTIGLWPADPTFSKFDLIGLDNWEASIRSIGVTRTSVLYDCGYGVQPSDDTPPRPQMAVEAQAPIEARFPGQFPNPRLISGSVPEGNFGDSYISLPAYFGDIFTALDIHTQQPISFGQGVPLPNPDTPPPLGSVVYGAPLFKGRGDQLLSILNPRGSPNLGNFGADNTFPSYAGTYTGVDLGGFKAGDRLMFATDTFLRKFWVGKNGVWHGQGGDAQGPPDGAPSCYLDGLGENYYPGCSTRIGPTTLRFMFGANDFAYPLPEAFRVYKGAFLNA